MGAISPATGLRRWHRRIAWVALIAACTFALTGLLHPLMTRLQVKPAQFKPPAPPTLAAALPAPAVALAAAGVGEVSALRPLHDGERWWWRVQTPDGAVRHLDPASGATPTDDGERAHAERLARWYAGEPTARIAQASLITRFDGDYGYTNRLLPVWKIAFARDDGLVAYVSTVDDRLATVSDHRKRLFQQSFRALHTWAWLPAPLRNGWINSLLLAVSATTLLGLWLLLRTPAGRRWNLRRLHRWGGAAVALAVLAWALSGFVQAWGNAERERADSPQRPLRVMAHQFTAPLSAPGEGVGSVALVSLDGQPAWRWSGSAPEATTGRGLAMGEHQHGQRAPQGVAASSAAQYVSARDGVAIAEGEARHLAELLAHFGVQAGAAQAQAVLKFSEEYGFLFKRLPVWRVEQADAAGTAFYLDTASERLAATITDADRLSGALFAYAHKWEWVTPLAGKDWRDGLGALFAFLVIAVALGGTLLRKSLHKP